MDTDTISAIRAYIDLYWRNHYRPPSNSDVARSFNKDAGTIKHILNSMPGMMYKYGWCIPEWVRDSIDKTKEEK